VVANVSRTVVEAMRRAYADVTVVRVMAPPEILAKRLAARARGSDGQLADRIRRAVDGVAVAPDITINNVGRAEHHARELVRIIKGD
jgi:ribose 1,5-bisphosphokinase